MTYEKLCESTAAAFATALLLRRAKVFRDSTKDLRPAEYDRDPLSGLVIWILAEEEDLDCTLADLSSTPSPDVENDDENLQDQWKP